MSVCVMIHGVLKVNTLCVACEYIVFYILIPTTGSAFFKLQWVAVSCSGLQSVAECCRVLWCVAVVAVCCGVLHVDTIEWLGTAQVAVCCSVRCSVLQCLVAVRCSVLQCVAVFCCSVLQCVVLLQCVAECCM